MQGEIEKVYLLHYRELYRFIMRLCQDPDITEDIIQNTFLEAIKSIEVYKGKSTVKTWLFSIAKHELYRHLRKTKVQVNLEEQLEEAVVEEDVSDKILADKIVETIKKLNPPQNEIMRLRLLYGLSFKEIGLRVGKTENYCRVNFFRIKEQLREEFDYEKL